MLCDNAFVSFSFLQLYFFCVSDFYSCISFACHWKHLFQLSTVQFILHFTGCICFYHFSTVVLVFLLIVSECICFNHFSTVVFLLHVSECIICFYQFSTVV